MKKWNVKNSKFSPQISTYPRFTRPEASGCRVKGEEKIYWSDWTWYCLLISSRNCWKNATCVRYVNHTANPWVLSIRTKLTLETDQGPHLNPMSVHEEPTGPDATITLEVELHRYLYLSGTQLNQPTKNGWCRYRGVISRAPSHPLEHMPSWFVTAVRCGQISFKFN